MRTALRQEWRRLGFVATILVGTGSQTTPVPEAPDPELSVVHLPGEGARLSFGDVDGDGDQDLLCAHAGGLDVYLQRNRTDDASGQPARGRFGAEPDRRFDWPGEDLAWCLADLSEDGAIELVGFVGAREVRAWPLDGEGPGLGAGRLEVSARGQLPRGRFPMGLLRDVNGDGRADLVLPEFGRFAIYQRTAPGAEERWTAPLTVKLEASVEFDFGSPDRLDGEFGQRVKIPWFSVRDVDGDGDEDLVSETRASVSFHLADPAIPDEPTWTLDLDALRSTLPDPEDVDFDDLLASLGGQVNWSVRDLDRRPPLDLVIQQGPKFLIHLGGSALGPIGPPDQLLKASGNVLGYLLRDVLGDELPELVIFRGERLSLARVLRWLILPGGLTFDYFTYENRDGLFSTRPTKRNAVALRFPHLLALIDRAEELEKELEGMVDVPARRIALDADGLENDIVDIFEGELLIYPDRLPAEEPPPDRSGEASLEFLDSALLEELGGLPDGETKTFDLEDLLDLDTSPGAALREAGGMVAPARRLVLASALEEVRIHVLDLDGEAPQDVLVLGKDSNGAWVAQVWVRP